MVEHERNEDPTRPRRSERAIRRDGPTHAAPSAAVLALQRSHGNAVVARWLSGAQDKLRPATADPG